jgi:hypothetical protein
VREGERGRGREGEGGWKGELWWCCDTFSLSTVVHHNSIHGAHNTHGPSQHRGSTSSESNPNDEKSRTSQTQSFVNELMQLLRCDNEAVGVQLRETVKEMVSYELSPPVYSYLFQCMTDETSKVCVGSV